MKEQYEQAIAAVSRLIPLHRSMGMDEEHEPRKTADEDPNPCPLCGGSGVVTESEWKRHKEKRFAS